MSKSSSGSSNSMIGSEMLPRTIGWSRMGLMGRRASGWRFSDAANEAAHQSIAVFNLGLAAWATGAYVGNGSKGEIASQRCTGSLGRCRFLKSSMLGLQTAQLYAWLVIEVDRYPKIRACLRQELKS